MLDGRWAAESLSASLGGGQSGVDAFLDDPAFELRHGHQDSQLESSSRVVGARIDSLAASYQGNFQPVQFVQDQGQMCKASTQPIEFVYDQPIDLPSADIPHQPIQRRPVRLGPRKPVCVLGQRTDSQEQELRRYCRQRGWKDLAFYQKRF